MIGHGTFRAQALAGRTRGERTVTVKSVGRSPDVPPGTLNRLIGAAISRKRRQSWAEILAPYERPDHRRSVLQLAETLALYGAMWAVLLESVEVGYWLTAIAALPAGVLMLRLIIIQHDCSHGSYFTSRRVCDAVGRIVATLALTSYGYTRKVHLAHHAHVGKLDIRLPGEIPTLTVAEYGASPWRRRLAYRLTRNPLVFMGVMIPIQFLLLNRFPARPPRFRTREWRSVWGTNAVLAAALAGVWLAFGAAQLGEVVLIQCLIAFFAGAPAAWLNHVQHQFEGVYRRRSGEWSFFDAGLHGSSWLALPKPLQWLTASIGLHHVHHLSTRIPNYRLQRCHDENPALWSAHRIGLRDGMKALNLALWDERRGKLISFREYRRLLAQ